MKEEEKDGLDALFASLDGKWDSEEPNSGHELRFLQKLDGKKAKPGWNVRQFLAIAASIVLLLGVFLTREQWSPRPQSKLSAENREAQHYFNSIIKNELAEIQKENTPESRILVSDALRRLATMDSDYQKLMAELGRKGESDQLIHAMITNLQTRIAFLRNVSEQIEAIKKIKASNHENKTI